MCCLYPPFGNRKRGDGSQGVSLVQARLLLLLHLVRGATGVSIVSACALTRKHFVSFTSDVTKQAWSALYKAVVDKLGPHAHLEDLAHLEGFSAGLSGKHVLIALRDSSKARQLFEAASRSWAKIINRMHCKGYILQPSDVLQLHKAVKGKIGLALRGKTLNKANRYTAMSLARSMAQLLAHAFGRSLTVYSVALHTAMSKGQSKGAVSRNEQAAFDAVVYQLFHIRNHAVFQKLLQKLQEKMQGCRCLSIRIQSAASITWATCLVHLCEVRQCLQRYGLAQLQELFDALRKASAQQLAAIRHHHKELSDRGYAGGSKCHAVWMTQQAAVALHLQLVPRKRTMKEMTGTRQQMHALLADYAHWQLSPKLSSLAIPEWRSMQTAADDVLSATQDLFENDPYLAKSFEDLRTLARSMGHRVARGMSRSDLLELVSSGKAVVAPKRTLESLRRLVRKSGANPQPRTSTTHSWTALDCRQYLLKRKTASELTDLCAEHLSNSPKRSRMQQIEALLAQTYVA